MLSSIFFRRLIKNFPRTCKARARAGKMPGPRPFVAIAAVYTRSLSGRAAAPVGTGIFKK